VIRIVVFGVLGLVGTGAVATLGRTPAPELNALAHAIDFPVPETSSKSDRLPLKAETDTTEAAATAMIDASPAAEMPAPVTEAPRPAEPKAPPRVISRHWHDPADTKRKPTKRNAFAKNRSPLVRVETPKQVSEVKNCKESELDTFLRSINLKPRCAS